ncbi:glycosyltransferase family 2 protein [bacterium]|nr:glycosyltransferase family 2 protein [bacterium]
MTEGEPRTRTSQLLSVVIPALNEAENIRETVHQLMACLRSEEIPFEIVVVNDASDDGTGQVLDELAQEDSAIKPVHRQQPRGVGRAVSAGLEHVTGTVVVIVMGDRSDDPLDVVTYYRTILQGYDCVFGSRFVSGSRVERYPPFKLALNRLANKFFQWMFWCPFNDLTNAFKGYRIEVIKQCQPYRACHFNIFIEMSMKAISVDYRIAQIPVRWYGREKGGSKLLLSRMGRRYLGTFLMVWSQWFFFRDDLLADQNANVTDRT